MARRPLDRIPQEQLAYELRHGIDRARRRPWDSQAVAEVARLIEENPRSANTAHVLHNIGAARRAWLSDQRARASGPLSGPPEAIRSHTEEP